MGSRRQALLKRSGTLSSNQKRVSREHVFIVRKVRASHFPQTRSFLLLSIRSRMYLVHAQLLASQRRRELCSRASHSFAAASLGLAAGVYRVGICDRFRPVSSFGSFKWLLRVLAHKLLSDGRVPAGLSSLPSGKFLGVGLLTSKSTPVWKGGDQYSPLILQHCCSVLRPSRQLHR